MTGILNLLAGAVSSVIKDTYFNLTTLLLPGNGTNGAQNNTFLDSSTNNFTITRNGNTTQGTFSPFSQTGWSNFFDGTDDRLSVPDASKLELGSSAFTIECFAYNTAWDVDQNQLFEKGRFSVGRSYRGWMTATAIVLEVNVSGSATGAYTSFSVSTTNNLNQWYHIAFVRSGNSIYIFKDGVQIGSTGTLSGTAFDTSEALAIGGAADGNNNIMMNGYISNFRIITGQALATGTFSIPTSPLTTSSSGWAVSGSPVSLTGTVALLTCQSNRFVDNSASPLDITVGGGAPSVQAFSPFAPTAAYSAATVGGSGYFDGTGDNLTVPTNSANSVGSGSFYFEAWVYLTNPSVAQMIIADPSNTGGLFVGLNIDGGGRFAIGRTAVGVDNFVNLTWVGNQWYHLAVNRNGTSLQFFVNGTQVGSTGTNSVNYPSVGYRVGAEQSAGSSPLTGYISGLRLVKSSVNTTNFTPPTAPPDASTAALCLQFTNAGITDATAKNDLETVGNAQISTTQSKFGGSSMLFDGTGDYLLFPSSPNLAFGTGDYTVEAWVYFTSISGAALQVIFRSGAGGNNFYFHVDSDQISVGTGSAFISNQATTFNTNTWYHIAACRSGTTLRLFRDGVQVGSSVTDSTNWVSTGIAGVGSNETGIQTVFGYIDDLRVSRYARYTANFTPPTTAFPLQ